VLGSTKAAGERQGAVATGLGGLRTGVEGRRDDAATEEAEAWHEEKIGDLDAALARCERARERRAPPDGVAPRARARGGGRRRGRGRGLRAARLQKEVAGVEGAVREARGVEVRDAGGHLDERADAGAEQRCAAPRVVHGAVAEQLLQRARRAVLLQGCGRALVPVTRVSMTWQCEPDRVQVTLTLEHAC
jgi:hypothetical protein